MVGTAGRTVMTKEQLQQELSRVEFREKAKMAARDRQERIFEAERTRLHAVNAELMAIRSRKIQLEAAIESRGKSHEKKYTETD